MIIKIETEDGDVVKTLHIDTDHLDHEDAGEALHREIRYAISENWKVLTGERQAQLDEIDDIFASLTGG